MIAAGGGRDLSWPHQRVAAELLACSAVRSVQRLFLGGARGADAAIARAAHQLGWSALALPAAWERHGRAAGPIRNRELLELAVTEALVHTSLVQQARLMASRSPVPLAVVEVSPSAGLWAVPAASACP
ncbi:hypothetical protein NZK32_07595 [Cyanobium sp. FGCU-52]|nr:hypothetical protein [Cyanobium sp. FGCU52]